MRRRRRPSLKPEQLCVDARMRKIIRESARFRGAGAMLWERSWRVGHGDGWQWCETAPYLIGIGFKITCKRIWLYKAQLMIQFFIKYGLFSKVLCIFLIIFLMIEGGSLHMKCTHFFNCMPKFANICSISHIN